MASKHYFEMSTELSTFYIDLYIVLKLMAYKQQDKEKFMWKTKLFLKKRIFHKKDYLLSWEDKENFEAKFYSNQISIALNYEISENSFAIAARGERGVYVDCRMIL